MRFFFQTVKTKQIGMITLMTTIILLVAISLMSVYTAQVGVTEQKISSNHYRAQQAFEAAEAGLNSGIDNLDMEIVKRVICVGTEVDLEGICTDTNSGTGIGSESAFVDLRAGTSLPDAATFTLAFRKNDADASIIDFLLSGYAGDNKVSFGNPNRNITQRLQMTPILSYDPPAALIARGDISLNANVTITNKITSSLTATWSGGGTSIVNTSLIDVTSLNGLKTGGYYQNDAALAALPLGDITTLPVKPNQYFENFFSQSFFKLKQRSTLINCKTGCNEAIFSPYVDVSGSPTTNRVIWIDANSGGLYDTLSISAVRHLGTFNNPILLIVDGNLILNTPDFHFFGIIYSTGDVQNNLGGRIFGSLISERKIFGPGALNVTYDKAIFKKLNLSMAFFTRVSGSWKDF